MTFYVVAGRATETNVALVSAIRQLGLEAEHVRPEQAQRRVGAGDVALGRVDVLPTLDGVEGCLWELRRLERRGARVLNGVGALLAAHDKLATALRLGRAGIRHPRTLHVDAGLEPAVQRLPVVLKPRFGSWGKDVVLCETAQDLARAFRRLRRRRWFRHHGVLVQELVPPLGHDLRVLVARGRVVGAVERRAAPGEWRTNVSLGGERRRTSPSPEACETAAAAAEAIGADFVGVDLLPAEHGDYVVLELNGAVDFTDEYSLQGGDVFADTAEALAAAVAETSEPAR
jgi:RimK family alpha-L-glutamate ligase